MTTKFQRHGIEELVDMKAFNTDNIYRGGTLSMSVADKLDQVEALILEGKLATAIKMIKECHKREKLAYNRLAKFG